MRSFGCREKKDWRKMDDTTLRKMGRCMPFKERQHVNLQLEKEDIRSVLLNQILQARFPALSSSNSPSSVYLWVLFSSFYRSTNIQVKKGRILSPIRSSVLKWCKALTIKLLADKQKGLESNQKCKFSGRLHVCFGLSLERMIRRTVGVPRSLRHKGKEKIRYFSSTLPGEITISSTCAMSDKHSKSSRIF